MGWKPQGWRRVLAAAGVTTLLAALAWVLLGQAVFTARRHSLPRTQRVTLEGAPRPKRGRTIALERWAERALARRELAG